MTVIWSDYVNRNFIAGTVCVSTLGQGYECLTPPSTNESVAIMSSGTVALTEKDIGALNDLVQSEVERHLVSIYNTKSLSQSHLL